MTEKKEEIDRARKEKLKPKQFTKNPINGTKFTLLISSAKGGVGKSTVAVNLVLLIGVLVKCLGASLSLTARSISSFFSVIIPLLLNLFLEEKSLYKVT